ncbi:methylmalonyl-CoA epimerase [Actinopolymorpha singaporensis]
MPDETSAPRPATPPVPPLFGSIDHVGVAVRDLDAAISWYEQTFGMRLAHIETNEEQGVREAMLEVGTSGPQLQLIAPLRDDSPVGRFLASRGEGLHQVAYSVDDLAEAAATLRSRGVELLYDRPRRGTAGTRVNFIHPKAAGGFLVELVQAAPEGAESTSDSPAETDRDTDR